MDSPALSRASPVLLVSRFGLAHAGEARGQEHPAVGIGRVGTQLPGGSGLSALATPPRSGLVEANALAA